MGVLSTIHCPWYRVFISMFWISELKEYKILLAIKQRYKKYWIIWISRLEHIRFWVSERKMQSIIDKLRKEGFIVLKWYRTCKKFRCCIYSVSKKLKKILEKTKEFVKKPFNLLQYTSEDVIAFASQRWKFKSGQWKIEINWNNYIVPIKWAYRWKIYSCNENRCVSLLSLLWN